MLLNDTSRLDLFKHTFPLSLHEEGELFYGIHLWKNLFIYLYTLDSMIKILLVIVSYIVPRSTNAFRNWRTVLHSRLQGRRISKFDASVYNTLSCNITYTQTCIAVPLNKLMLFLSLCVAFAGMCSLIASTVASVLRRRNTATIKVEVINSFAILLKIVIFSLTAQYQVTY